MLIVVSGVVVAVVAPDIGVNNAKEKKQKQKQKTKINDIMSNSYTIDDADSSSNDNWQQHQ